MHPPVNVLHFGCQLQLTSFPLPSDPNVVRGHNVINVIIPESRVHFFQQMGYILATLLLFMVLLVIVVLITRKRRQRGKALETTSPAVLIGVSADRRAVTSVLGVTVIWEGLVGLDTPAHSVSSPCLGYEYNVKKYGE